MSRDTVGKLIHDMAALDEEEWDGDYITYLEQHGAEIVQLHQVCLLKNQIRNIMILNLL